MPIRKKIAVYSAAGCRACEQALLDIHYQVYPLTDGGDFVFWPYVLGSDWQDLEREPEIDVCFFMGAIATSEERQAALILRRLSRYLIACGSCAHLGGLIGLANHTPLSDRKQPTAEEKVVSSMNGDLENCGELPLLEPKVSALSHWVDVDYFVPGCPPRQNLLWAAVQSIVLETSTPVRLSYSALRLPHPIAQAITSGVFPPKGSVFSGERAVCATCSRSKEKKQFRQFHRLWNAAPEAGRCLLEQGFLCSGVVTREGCGGVCTAAGLPCRGCFGKTDAVFDPGAKMISTVASAIDSDDPEEITAWLDPIVDLAGTLYRYNLATQCTLCSPPAAPVPGQGQGTDPRTTVQESRSGGKE